MPCARMGPWTVRKRSLTARSKSWTAREKRDDSPTVPQADEVMTCVLI